MLGEIPVRVAVAWNRDADGGGDEPVRLARGGFRHHDEGDLSRLEELDALGAREDAALGRKDARHADEIARRDADRPQRQLERSQLLAMLPDTLGEEHLLRDETDHAHT